MNLIKKIALYLIVNGLFVGCVSKKEIIYFQNEKINQSLVSNDFVTIFKSDDLLRINVSALDLNSVRPFNLPMVNSLQNINDDIGQPTQQNYLIDANGYIDFPVLGKLKVGGKSRKEVIQMFKDKLDPEYVKNPNINIFIMNFRVTVTGDVARPGSFIIPNERISLIEALGLAGDLNISANRKNIKVIREERGEKKTYEVSLLSNDIFTSPVYYLRQNDLIYVEPNYARIQSASSNSNTSLFISITGLLVTLVTLLTR